MAQKHWTVDYISHVLEQKNWNMNQLAEASGVAASTINRPLREKNWKYGLSPKTVGKIHRATGIDPAPFAPDGLDEPTAMYSASGSARPRTVADDVLSEMDEPKELISAQNVNDIRVAVAGPVVQIVATVDREGIARLRRKLDVIEQMLDD